MNAIAAVDKNWGIGKDGDLLIHIPEDMKFFRDMTTGKVVIMGRKTFESLPGRKPLKDRINIILSRDTSFKTEGAIVCHSVEEVLETVRNYPPDDVFVIGGGTVYSILLPYCSKAYITRIDKEFECDTFFPNLTKHGSWIIENESPWKVWNEVRYKFCIHERHKI